MLRPADYQVTTHYRCMSCGEEKRIDWFYIADRCPCGGIFVESYPFDTSERDEERDRRPYRHIN